MARKRTLTAKEKAAAGLQTSAIKVLLHPSLEQAGQLDGQSKICNWLWNKLKNEVEARFQLLRHGYMYGVLKDDDADTRLLFDIYGPRGLRNLVPVLKAQHPFLHSVYSSPTKNIALRMTAAIKRHQAGGGWIQFHAWRKTWTSIEYDEPNKGWSLAEPGWLSLTFGTNAAGERHRARIRMAALPPRYAAQAKTCRIVKEHGQYFAVFTSTYYGKTRPVGSRAVYLDPNHKNFAYGLSNEGDAFEIANLPDLMAAERRVDYLKQQRDSCLRKSLWVDTVREDGSVGTHWSPSRQWTKRDTVLKRFESRLRKQKKQALYGLANQLCSAYDVIGIGDYVPAAADHGRGEVYNRAVVNRTFHGQFKAILAWVGSKSGKRVQVLDEAGTTRTCHCCQHKVPGGLPPDVRQWTCPSCAATHHRDENATQNGLAKLLGCLDMPRSGPVTIRSRCDWRYTHAGWHKASRTRDDANVNQTYPAEHRRLDRQLSRGGNRTSCAEQLCTSRA